MPLATPLLYSGVALIWGSTWLAITFQLGETAPLASVIYRFGLATVMLFVWCLWKKIDVRMNRRQHVLMGVQGTFLFGLNYWVLYLATEHLTSGLIAAVFTTIVFFNALNGRLFLALPVRRGVLVGGAIGLAGVAMLFVREIEGFTLTGESGAGMLLALLATLLASLGNIAAAKNISGGRSVLVINAWAMLYGTVVMIVAAVVLGVEFSLDGRLSYWLSLGYLSLFGSLFTFAGYLRLIAILGPDKAGNMSMLVPVIALGLSSVFEGYMWTPAAMAGLVCILFGNWVALRR